MDVGLSDKEAKVYLAVLELGPSTVQAISHKSAVKRATCYVAIDGLVDRGLMSSFKKGKKSYFSAANPEQLEVIVSDQKNEVENREKVVKNIVGDLKALALFSSNTPSVNYYEGWEGIKSLREDILRTNNSVVRELVSIDEAKKVLANTQGKKDVVKHKFGKKVSFKTIYTSKEGMVLPKKSGNNEARYVPKDKFPVGCEVVIYGTNVVFLMYSGKPTGIHINDKNVALTVSSMFDSLWHSAK